MSAGVATRCDLRGSFGDARNQGDRPTCLAFALSDAHGAALAPSMDLSAEHLYYHAVKRTPGCHPDDGVSLPMACDALKLDGQAREGGWPYLAKIPSDLSKWTPPPTAIPLFRRGTQAALPAVSDIVANLNAGRPVVLIVLLGERFYTPVSGLVAPGPNDADTDYHAVVAVGHGVTVSGELCILIRNSWGHDWGAEGHGWITASYLQPRLNAALTMDKTPP